MIRSVWIANPFNAKAREVVEIPFREGLTVDDVLPSRLACRESLTVRRNGDPATLLDPLFDGDIVLATAAPGGIPTGALIAIQIGLAVLSTIIAKAQGGKRRSDKDSPVYGFDGPANIRQEGQPRPIVYGLFRYPGTILQEYTRTFASPARSDYYALLGFGYGPVQEICGFSADTADDAQVTSGDATFPSNGALLINNNDAENFKGITLAVRMGTIEQTAIAGDPIDFSTVTQQVTVSQALKSIETSSEDNSTDVFDASTFTGATADTHFDAYGVPYSLTDDYDSFRVTVNFPQGLYRTSSTGTVHGTRVDVAVRYIELDTSGAPIASGGPEGDGWVRLPPEASINSISRNPFAFEFEYPFYDPQTYTHNTSGRALILDYAGTDDFGSKATPTLPSSGSGTVTGLSVSTWINLDTLTPDSGSTGFTLAEHVNGSNGWRFAIVPSTTGSGLFVPNVTVGTGSTLVDYEASLTGIAAAAWYMLTFTYKKNAGSSGTLKIYVNGSLVFTLTSTSVMTLASTATFYVGKKGAGGDPVKGKFDELEILDSVLTQTEITARWASGTGQYQTATSHHYGLWHFDATSSATAVDSSSHSNDLTLANGANMPAGFNGLVPVPPGSPNTAKRSRYKVEVVRVNYDSTNANTADECQLQYVAGILDISFTLPTTPLLAMKIEATEQLNGSFPTINALLKGRQVPVWDGLSTSNPQFYRAWSRNPAWICLDAILDPFCGLGRQYSSTDVDVQSFQDLADYSDELIYDLQGTFTFAAGQWSNMTYTGASGVGSIVIQFGATGFGALKWIVGDSVGCDGIPDGGGGSIDNPAPSGYAITAMDAVNHTVTIAVSLASGVDPWTSGTTLSSHVTVAGTLEGREPRYCFDGAFDTDRSAWDGIMHILSTAHAIPVRDGKRIRIKTEMSREPVDLVGIGSMVAGSFEVNYGGGRDRPNSYIAQFKDEDRNHADSPVIVDHPSVQDATALEVLRRESITLDGICRRSQAMRHCAFLLNLNDAIIREGTFRAHIDALPYEVGDVLALSADVTEWGESGRAYATSAVGVLTLDRNVTLDGSTYLIRIRNSATGLTETSTVTSGAGSYVVGSDLTVSPDFSFAPQRDDAYVLYHDGEEKLVQVTSTSLAADFTREITWAEYDVDVYDIDWVGDI